MANTRQKAWFVSRHQTTYETSNPDVLRHYIGIVEQTTNAISKGGKTSDWQALSYSAVNGASIYLITTDGNLGALSPPSSDEYLLIPVQFHEAIVSKAIAEGYKTPPNMNLQIASYFEAEYLKKVKEGRKVAKTRYTSDGFVSPQDF